MDECRYEATTRISDEVCPECGEHISYGKNPYFSYETRLTCPCRVAKEEAERKQFVDEGVIIVRAALRKLSGVKARYQDIFLENIKPRAGQAEAVGKALDFVGKYFDDKSGAGLILSGSVGSGKTLIAAAAVNSILNAMPIREQTAEYAGRDGKYYSGGKKIPIFFTSVIEFLENIRQEMNEKQCDGNKQSVKLRAKDSYLLVLDDLGAEKMTEWAQETILEVIDHRYSELLPVIVTTNASPKELKARIGERSFDRLREMCECIAVTSGSQRSTAGKP